MSSNLLKKTLLFTDEETLDLVTRRVDELGKITSIKKSRIMEAALVAQLAPEHPKAKLWKNILMVEETEKDLESRL